MLSPVLTRTRRDESGGESWTEGRGRELQLSAFSFQLSLLSCCVSFVRPEMQPFIEEYSSNNCERHVSECGTDFSVQVKLAQISGIALKIHASGEASTNCMKHGVISDFT